MGPRGILLAFALCCLPALPAPRPLIEAVAAAWEVPRHRIVAPEWFHEARYEVTAANSRAALRQALEEKYRIVAGWETRPAETWVLECPWPASLAASPEQMTGSLNLGSGSVHGSATFEMLAQALPAVLGAGVIDETGVGGTFRFSLSWPPGDTDAMARAFRSAGLELTRQYRDARFLVVYSATWPDPPPPPPPVCEPPPALGRAMAAQDRLAREPSPAAWSEWVAARYRAALDHPAAAFLDARQKAPADPTRALEMLRDLLRGAPHFALAWQFAASLTAPGPEREARLLRFRELCPAPTPPAAPARPTTP